MDEAKKGISMNNLVFRKPTMVLRSNLELEDTTSRRAKHGDTNSLYHFTYEQLSTLWSS
jgi:hypothetical protein